MVEGRVDAGELEVEELSGVLEELMTVTAHLEVDFDGWQISILHVHFQPHLREERGGREKERGAGERRSRREDSLVTSFAK